MDNRLLFEKAALKAPGLLLYAILTQIKIFIQKMRSCCMKFKAHVLNQVKVLYVSKVITAPQPELRLGLFNVPAAIQWSVLCGIK